MERPSPAALLLLCVMCVAGPAAAQDSPCEPERQQEQGQEQEQAQEQELEPGQEPEPEQQPEPEAEPGPEPQPEAGGAPVEAADEPEEKFIKMYVEQWKWTPDVIRVKQGTRLKIEFLSYEASRRFDLKAYKIKLPLPQDKPVTHEFVADRKGEFTYRCGRPCGDGCAKLTGKLIVE